MSERKRHCQAQSISPQPKQINMSSINKSVSRQRRFVSLFCLGDCALFVFFSGSHFAFLSLSNFHFLQFQSMSKVDFLSLTNEKRLIFAASDYGFHELCDFLAPEEIGLHIEAINLLLCKHPFDNVDTHSNNVNQHIEYFEENLSKMTDDLEARYRKWADSMLIYYQNKVYYDVVTDPSCMEGGGAWLAREELFKSKALRDMVISKRPELESMVEAVNDEFGPTYQLLMGAVEAMQLDSASADELKSKVMKVRSWRIDEVIEEAKEVVADKKQIAAKEDRLALWLEEKLDLNSDKGVRHQLCRALLEKVDESAS